jgi:hypothetical protein
MGQRGGLAQLVEHRTENPCVPGSSPGSTTTLKIIKPFLHMQDGLCCLSEVQELFRRYKK